MPESDARSVRKVPESDARSVPAAFIVKKPNEKNTTTKKNHMCRCVYLKLGSVASLRYTRHYITYYIGMRAHAVKWGGGGGEATTIM